MEKSLLKILRMEEELACEINRVENRIAILQEQRQRVMASPFDCPAKRSDIERYDKMIAQERDEMQGRHAELSAVRAELRNWMRALLEI